MITKVQIEWYTKADRQHFNLGPYTFLGLLLYKNDLPHRRYFFLGRYYGH